MTIDTICVCGAGTMGNGIAQVTASAGFKTILYELNKDILEKAKTSIEKNLEVLVGKNKITEEEKGKIFQRIRYINDYHECLADVVVEAIIENPDAKIALFTQLPEINNDETIFAPNTSIL